MRQRIARHDVAITEREERLAAVIKHLFECDGVAAGELQMPAEAVLQTRKTEYQAESPEAQQKNQRQRSEVGQKAFTPRCRLDAPRNPHPSRPCGSVKESGDSEGALDAARQHDRFKGVEQNNEDEDNAGNRRQPVHTR